MDQREKETVEEGAIWNGLNIFRASFDSICKDRSVPCNTDILGQLSDSDLRRLSLNLLVALQNLPAIKAVPSRTGRGTVESDLLRLFSAVTADNFDFNRVTRLLKEALTDKPRDTLIWELVSSAAVESTPPPSLQQTPWSRNTSSFVNSSALRQDVDRVLKQELGPLYVGVPDFCDTFFKGVPDLETAPKTAFSKCSKGDNPLFCGGWTGWPANAKESDVLAWFIDLVPRLEAFAGNSNSTLLNRRKLLVQPNTPLLGSIGKRSTDIGFVNSDITYTPNSARDPKYRWSHILVAGELKSTPNADIASLAWIDLARYAREVLAAQDTRRFLLGFTLCGSLMRVWEFDRLGGIASEQFDINKEEGGLQFVTIILGFLWMNEELLGFDPTIVTSGGQKYIEIEQNGQTECLIIHSVIRRARCIAGRATTCWKAYRKDDPRASLVIKDSWQYTDWEEEGDMVQEATKKGVINVARYYHHETVRVRRTDDDIQNNIRKGQDVTKATNYRPERTVLPSSVSSISRRGQSSSGMKRSSMFNYQIEYTGELILRDYGIPIYKASSRVALLAALEGCIKGHESLYNAGFLHRDISINNLMINEDEGNPSWPAFLIDLDLAIRNQREGVSGANEKTGTRAFMAIGALLGEEHSFMHDLESFFWVLFWICIHYNSSGDSNLIPHFETWNYIDTEQLAVIKKGEIVDEEDFLRKAGKNFTRHYQPLLPWVNRLRRIVFPNGVRWKRLEPELYSSMRKILQEAQEDPVVVDGH
ncbi:hypothetical protein ED733_001671 [Metarhizium rileyi]|uniref:non-specific serine/threonine protein kinase n=1 Tax=Metarhizium rileyi (strain RCEF 4871) TaxID=1649241 RepID=A0A5C6G2J9_METRR|nr:hypothetical protein ED733_001671 [Metarhizium rileyi]